MQEINLHLRVKIVAVALLGARSPVIAIADTVNAVLGPTECEWNPCLMTRVATDLLGRGGKGWCRAVTEPRVVFHLL